MTTSALLNSLINHAELNGKPEVAAALKLLRDPVAALEADRDALKFQSSCNDTDMTDAELVAALSDELLDITDDADNGVCGTILSKVQAMKEVFPLLNQAKARIAELEARTGPVPAQWRPIELAPTDGTHVLVLFWNFNEPGGSRGITMAHAVSGSWIDSNECREIHPPTHFMPLPAPPTQETQP